MEMDTLYGMLDMPDWPDDLIVDALCQYGEWGVRETDILAHLLPEDTVLWDCGAFLGTFTLGVARATPLVRALAIEANADLIPHLSRNLSRLAPCPTTVVHSGVGARDGTVALRIQGNDPQNHGAQSYDYTDALADTPCSIACSTLRKLRISHSDYTALKLDLEGMEVDAIKGDYAYIAKTRPLLWAECNETQDSLLILSAMKSLGYNPVYIAFPAFRTDNYRAMRDLRYPLAYEAALFAAPAELLAHVDWQARAFDNTIIRPVQTRADLRKALFDTPRWGKKDWEGLSRAELLGRLTRTESRQSLKDFLS